MKDCQASPRTDSVIAPQVSQQTTPSIAQSTGRLATPVPITPPSVWASDFFWITLAVSVLVGVILDKWHRK